jgi:hypothetical protein
MAAAAIPLATTAFSVASSVSKGRAARKAADSEAAQISDNARRAREEGQSRADEIRRQTNRQMSDAQAIQGGSGFSASDAQALKQIGDISGAGKYNELAQLYQADSQATGMERQARETKKAGRRAQRSAYLGAVSTAFSGGSKIKDGFNAFKESRVNRGMGVPVVQSVPSFRSSSGTTSFGAGPRGGSIGRRAY